MPLYTAYGLVFESVISLPEFSPQAEPASVDVCICMGDVPTSLENPRDIGSFYQIGQDELLYGIPGIARYLVRHGNEIIISPEAHTDEASIRAILLTSVLSALLHQRKMLPMRASAIETPRGAALFMGYSSTGKSTLAAAFVQKGYRLISDNMTTLELQGDGALYAQQAYPTLKLWSLTASHFGMDVEQMQRFRPNMNCYLWPVGDRFRASPQKIAAIYLLALSAVPHLPQPKSLDDHERLFALTNNLYHDRFAVRMGIISQYWDRLLRASSLPMIRIRVGLELDDLAETINFVESDLK